MSDLNFYNKQDKEELVSMCIARDNKINNLEQENKQLKSILTELEEWLNKEMLGGRSKDHLWLQGCYDEDKLVLNKIQELKEKYK